MSYRNPQIIIDNSGDIWGKAIAGFGANIAKGIDTFAAAQAKGQEAANKRRESNQLALNISELKENERINKFVATLKDKSMNEQVGESIREMATTGVGNTVKVNGKDYTMGAIKAQALLNSDPNIDKDTREAYIKIISGYNQHMDFMGGVAANVTVNNQELKPDQPGFISKDYDIQGEGGEGTANLIAAMSVNNQPLKGVESEKVYGRNLNEETGKYDNTLTINSRIDKESDIYKSWLKNGLTTNGSEEKGNLTQQFEEELDYQGNPTGYLISKYERNLNELGEEGLGLIVKIPPASDASSGLTGAGFLDPKTHKETGLGFVTEKIKRTSIDDDGNTVEATETHFDKKSLITNKAYQDIHMADAEKIIHYPLDQQMKYMANNLGWGNIDKAAWAEMADDPKKELITKTLAERDMRNIMGVSKNNLLQSREATQEDVAQYEADGKEIKIGDDIYFTQNLKTTKKASSEGASVSQQISLAKYNASLKNASKAVKSAADRGLSILNNTNSALKNVNIAGYGKVESAEIVDGKLNFIHETGKGGRKDGTYTVDRTARSIDLNDKDELNTFANQLYSGDSNSDKREAFIKSIELQLSSSDTELGEQADRERASALGGIGTTTNNIAPGDSLFKKK